MPFKSQAQRRKFAQLLVDGKISNETFEEWNRDTGVKRLPERVKRDPRYFGRSHPASRPDSRMWRQIVSARAAVGAPGVRAAADGEAVG